MDRTAPQAPFGTQAATLLQRRRERKDGWRDSEEGKAEGRTQEGISGREAGGMTSAVYSPVQDVRNTSRGRLVVL